MRIAVAALCVLALTGTVEAEPASAYCREAVSHIPKAYRAEPSVKWQVFNVPERQLAKQCGYSGPHTVHSCTYPADGYWAIIMPDNISLDEYACRLAYEKAHMPPSFWADPKIESPQTIQWLVEQKAAYLKGQTSPW